MRSKAFPLALCLALCFFQSLILPSVIRVEATIGEQHSRLFLHTTSTEQARTSVTQGHVSGYSVEVLLKGNWGKAGFLPFNHYFSQKVLGLKPFLGDRQEARIRIRQEGGAAAHIDSVSIEGKVPRLVSGLSESNVYRKLAKRDFDVVDAYQRTIELIFDLKGVQERTVNLVERVEPHEISKVPF